VGTGIPNDNRPNGILIASGVLSGSNGQTASGQAEIYNNSGTYIARLNGITVTSETGLQIIVATSLSQTAYRTTLRSSQGSQNYTMGSIVGTFAQVRIFSTRNNRDYAVATLVYTGQGT
jgi:hypothetical protein